MSTLLSRGEIKSVLHGINVSGGSAAVGMRGECAVATSLLPRRCHSLTVKRHGTSFYSDDIKYYWYMLESGVYVYAAKRIINRLLYIMLKSRIIKPTGPPVPDVALRER